MSKNFGSRSARLFAVQAIYQTMYCDSSLKDIIEQFRSFHFDILNKDNLSKSKKVNFDLFSDIVTYSHNNNDDLNKIISTFIKETWRLERLNSIVKSILYCGISELEIDEKKNISFLINEYIDIAKRFLESPDVAFINNILDKAAHQIKQ